MPSPIIALDHLCIATSDVDTDCANYRNLLGFEPSFEGVVQGRPTAVFRTGNVHLVLTTPTGDESGLCGVCFRVDDRERLRRRMGRLSLRLDRDAALDPVAALGGNGDGLDVLDPNACRGLAIAFTGRREAPPAPASPRVQGLDHVVVASTDVVATGFVLGAQLGLDLRMDVTRRDWNGRLLFFRCADLIVEVFQRIGDTASADGEGDRLYGLSWRVDDAEVAHDALAARGVDVSALRVGRKPGTRVFTVRDGTAGVATLMLEPAAARQQV